MAGRVFNVLIIGFIIIMFIAAFLPDFQTATENVSDDADVPAMTRTTFSIVNWALPVGGVVAVIYMGIRLFQRGGGRRFRRRR